VATRVADNIIANSASSTKKARKVTFGLTIQAKNSRSVYDEESDAITILQDIYISDIAENSLISTTTLQVGEKINSVTIKGKTYLLTRLFQLIDLCWLIESGDIVQFNIEGRNLPVSVVVSESYFSDVA